MKKKIKSGKKLLNFRIFLSQKIVKNFLIKNKNKKRIKKKLLKKLFKWPISGRVIVTYGVKSAGRRNDGINIKAPKGTPVRAAMAGKVIYKGNELPAWGNLVLVK